jgi:hypothetical protein
MDGNGGRLMDGSGGRLMDGSGGRLRDGSGGRLIDGNGGGVPDGTGTLPLGDERCAGGLAADKPTKGTRRIAILEKCIVNH